MKISRNKEESYILTQCSSCVSSLDIWASLTVHILKTDGKSLTLIDCYRHVIGF